MSEGRSVLIQIADRSDLRKECYHEDIFDFVGASYHLSQAGECSGNTFVFSVLR